MKIVWKIIQYTFVGLTGLILGILIAGRYIDASTLKSEITETPIYKTVVITKTVYEEFEKCKNLGGKFFAGTDFENEYYQECTSKKEIELK